jgi:hypothetical protein
MKFKKDNFFSEMIRVFIMQDTISKEFMTMFLTSKLPRCYVSSTLYEI